MLANAAQARIVSQVLIWRELADVVAIRADTPVRPSSRIRQEARLVKPGTTSIVAGLEWFARKKAHHRGTETQRRKSTARRAKRCVPFSVSQCLCGGNSCLLCRERRRRPAWWCRNHGPAKSSRSATFCDPPPIRRREGVGGRFGFRGRGKRRRATTLYVATRDGVGPRERHGRRWWPGTECGCAQRPYTRVCGTAEPGRRGSARTAGRRWWPARNAEGVQRPYTRYAGRASREGVVPRERHGCPSPDGVGPRGRHGRRWRSSAKCGGAQRPYTRHADRTSREGAGPSGGRGRRWWPSAECGGAQRPYMRHAGRRGRDGRGPRRRRATVAVERRSGDGAGADGMSPVLGFHWAGAGGRKP